MTKLTKPTPTVEAAIRAGLGLLARGDGSIADHVTGLAEAAAEEARAWLEACGRPDAAAMTVLDVPEEVADLFKQALSFFCGRTLASRRPAVMAAIRWVDERAGFTDPGRPIGSVRCRPAKTEMLTEEGWAEIPTSPAVVQATAWKARAEILRAQLVNIIRGSNQGRWIVVDSSGESVDGGIAPDGSKGEAPDGCWDAESGPVPAGGLLTAVSWEPYDAGEQASWLHSVAASAEAALATAEMPLEEGEGLGGSG